MDDDRNRQFDLGSLTLYDSNPLSDKALSGQELNDALINRTGGNIYYMLSQMINMLKIHKEEQERLPEEQQLHDFSKSQYSLRLPPTNTVFPRSRKIPKKKEMTKWQKFAKEKGIKKTKRSGKVFDEETQQYMARWGSKSKKNMDVPIMEEKQPGVNPFKERQVQKKLRVAKQKLRQQKNRTRNTN